MDTEDFSIDIPTVHIETESFDADVIEMYEMPSKMVMPLMSSSGPDQMEQMLSLFKLAVVDPAKADVLDALSFSEMSTALMQWYMGSIIRMRREARELEEEMEDLDAMIRDAKSILGEKKAEHKTSELKTNFNIRQKDDGSIEIVRLDGPASNDPGDNISPFDL